MLVEGRSRALLSYCTDDIGTRSRRGVLAGRRPMPRFFFHLIGSESIKDQDGTEFATVGEARQHACAVAQELAHNGGKSRKGDAAIVAVDHEGRELLRVPLWTIR
jgi:Domain of unknown function (DUF6894)